MSEYADMRWHGPREVLEQALLALPQPEAQVGPRVLDGTAYVLRRTREATALPEGLEATGPELSIALLGVIAEETA